jgi:hypothetical protein
MTTYPSPRRRVSRMLVLLIGALVAAFLGAPLAAGTTSSPGASPSTSPSGSPGAAAGIVQNPKAVTFGVQTATAAGIDKRGVFSYGATPGATLVDHVAFVNYSVKPIEVTVYPADAYNTPDDGFALLTQTQGSKDAGSWIRLELLSQTLHLRGRAPNGRPYVRIVTVDLHVPADANPGDHTAGIVASFLGLAKTSQGDVVKLNQRVGTRVLVRVSGPLHPGFVIQGLRAHWGGPWTPFGSGHVNVSYRVHNNGNVRLAGQQQVTVKGWVGSRIAKPGDFSLLLPDNTVTSRISVKHVFPGFRLKVTVRALPVAAAGDAPLLAHPVVSTVTVWAIPWTGLGCLVLVLLCVLGIRRWRRRKPPAPAPAAAGVASSAPIGAAQT